MAGWLAVDSAPLETTKVVRSQTGRESIPEAAYHFGSCGRNLFFGFRLHTTVTDAGAIVEFALASANEGERAVAEGMLAAVPPAETGVVLGDNNYCGDAQVVAAPYGVVETSPRKTDKDRTSRLWVRGPRVIVETVFGMLADQFNGRRRERAACGVWSPKVLAFDASTSTRCWGALSSRSRASTHSISRSSEVFEFVRQATPLQQTVTPEQFADAVLFFASPWSRSVTGQSLAVDGGLTMA